MRRRGGFVVSLCAATVAAAAVSSGAVTARPPIIKPPPVTDDFEAALPADESCGDFGVVVTPETGKSLVIVFANGRGLLAAPGAKYRVTRADDKNSFVVVQGTGAFHESPAEFLDPPVEYGGVDYELAIPTKLTGHNLLVGSFVGADGTVTVGAFAVQGKASTTFLLDFETGQFAFADLRGGRSTDLCAVLR